MSDLLYKLLLETASSQPENAALSYQGAQMSYAELAGEAEHVAIALVRHGLMRRERVGIYLAKQFETVSAFFGAVMAGGVFVPINPALKARQVGHIMRDCNVRVLVTSRDRLAGLQEILPVCHDLRLVVTVDGPAVGDGVEGVTFLEWSDLAASGAPLGSGLPRVIDSDMAAILYTSGSTGLPKGVVLSHRNMVAGARSVAEYLGNSAEDVVVAVPPFSFDYGLSQLTTCFSVGAKVVLMNYLFARDVIKQVVREGATGLPCVPPVWIELAALDWPAAARQSLRYITSTGGRMPVSVTKALQTSLPQTKVFLMYGLTEAFRSTYLPPDQVAVRPESIGKAIPNAEILVVRPDGELCGPNEPGELVHRGALVSLGYWNDPVRTAERFKPAPGQPAGIQVTETAVWSGDQVRMDEEGYLYFIGRDDEMIKTSGYRVSPTEVEEVIYASGEVAETAVFGVTHPKLGQAVVAVVVPKSAELFNQDNVMAVCRRELPNYMVPVLLEQVDGLPRNPNGKLDRKKITADFADRFGEASHAPA